MARRFRFNLEAVLRYRGLLEDQRRREFAEANRRVEEERLRREELVRERSALQDEIVRHYQEQAPFQSIVACYRAAGSLERSAAESERRRLGFEAEAERRRLELVAASRDKRVMESLKERRREEFLREQDRQEQLLLDEMSIQARARRRLDEAGLDSAVPPAQPRAGDPVGTFNGP